MPDTILTRRRWLALGAAALLAGCQTPPRQVVATPPAPPASSPDPIAVIKPPPRPPRIGLALGAVPRAVSRTSA